MAIIKIHVCLATQPPKRLRHPLLILVPWCSIHLVVNHVKSKFLTTRLGFHHECYSYSCLTAFTAGFGQKWFVVVGCGSSGAIFATPNYLIWTLEASSSPFQNVALPLHWPKTLQIFPWCTINISSGKRHSLKWGIALVVSTFICVFLDKYKTEDMGSIVKNDDYTSVSTCLYLFWKF